MSTMHEIDYQIFGQEMQYVEVEFDPMEAAVAEAGGMMYMEDGIQMETGKVKTAFFGGEGLFFALLRGPGKVYLQSLPFSRLAGRVMAAAGGGKGEGSLLGGLLDGDNS
jgi:uncharacterized protein (AIM24 family)